MKLTVNVLGLATVVLLASSVRSQDHAVTPYDSRDRPLPDLVSPSVWPPPLPRFARRPSVPMGPTVSVDEVHVPSAAKKELKLFQRSFQSNNIQDAAKHLENAIEIYPQNALIHQYLGVCYFGLHQYDKAVTQFQSASILDEHLIEAYVSLSVVFLLQARYPEAEAAARHALEFKGTIPEAQYLLGAVLAAQGRDTTETTELLRESSRRYPVAHLILAELFLRRNSKDEAVAELRQYLKGPGLPQEEQHKAACLVEKLTESPGSSARNPKW